MIVMPLYMVLPTLFWGCLAIGLFEDASALLGALIFGAIWYLVIQHTNWYPRSRAFLARFRK